MKILIATHNKKKKAELQRILLPLGIEIVTADDIGISLTDVEETGTTFEENSFLYSARYAGEHGNDEKNIDKLLEALKDVPDEKRTAKFVCAVTCVFPDGKVIRTRGECHGVIAHERIGHGGFGYDPVFLCGEKSFGELTSEEKDAVSHRGKALRMLVQELEKNI